MTWPPGASIWMTEASERREDAGRVEAMMGLEESIVDALGKTSLGRIGVGRVCFAAGGFGIAGRVVVVTSPGAGELKVLLPAVATSLLTAGRARFRGGASFRGSNWV